MPVTNFPYGVSSFGMPLAGGGYPGIGTSVGKYIFVDADNGHDGNTGTSWDDAVKTIAQAYSLVTTNRDDTIILSTNGVHTLTSMLTISKNRVHFVGDMRGRLYGQRARIYMATTTATTDLFMVKNLGVGNSFTGIKFWNANALTQNIGCVGEGGEYALYLHCEFYDSTKLTSDTHAEMVLNGDSAQFFNCTFGSLADAVTGDKVRPAVLMTAGTVGDGLVSRDVLFDGCKFWKKAGGTTTSFIKIAATADIERGMEIKNCSFIASILGSTPATAITSATLTNGYVMLSGDTIAYNCTKVGTATGILNGTPARVATATIGIQAT
jgi:hypothetical protein